VIGGPFKPHKNAIKGVVGGEVEMEKGHIGYSHGD
jgi:hypothetical protein